MIKLGHFFSKNKQKQGVTMNDSVCTPEIPITREIDGFTFINKSVHDVCIKHYESKVKAQQEVIDEFNKDRRRLYRELTRLNDLLCNGYIYYDDTTESVINQYIETGKRARQALEKIKQEDEK